MDKKETQIQSYNLGQLAKLYNVSRPTIKKWIEPFLNELGKADNSKIYSPRQIKIIFENLGTP